jgi:hypothetical protein
MTPKPAGPTPDTYLLRACSLRSEEPRSVDPRLFRFDPTEARELSLPTPEHGSSGSARVSSPSAFGGVG